MSNEPTPDAGFNEADIRSVAAKLATLELTEREMAALVALVTDDDDVIGHALGFEVRRSFRAELSGLREQKGLGGIRNRGVRGY